MKNRTGGRDGLRRYRPWLAALVCLAGVAAGTPSAARAGDAPAAGEASAAPAGSGLPRALLRQAQGRAGDADTLLSLTQEGALLYEQDAVKLSGYQYCSQAVGLAEQGDFRQSVRAASKALYLADATDDPELKARALRDLAIVYSYAGQLDKAEQFARDALTHQVRDPAQIQGPSHKVIGDVQSRRGDVAAAARSYETALQGSSERYAPLVRTSWANALIEAGDTARARAVLAEAAPGQDAGLTAQWQRTQARLLLAEGQPEQARERYLALTQQRGGTDAAYYRLWAWEGVARSEAALGNRQAAADALGHALRSVDDVRARFRSDEFKMGLFSDVQGIFEQAVSLRAALGEPERAFEASEHSRSRALLDAVRGRASVQEDSTRVLDLPALQRHLRPDERIVQFHALPDALLAWVIGPDTFASHRIAVGRDALAQVVEAFRDAVTTGRRSAIPAAEQLGALLLAPLGLQAGQRVVVVPHGPLHYLPFQALRLDGQYLIERHPVSVAPSGSIAARLAERSPTVPAELVAFGNPRIEDDYDLPGAEREVRQLAGLFPSHRLFMGTAATKTAFAQAAASAPVMHVAAHALADTVDPLYSRILLANEDGKQRFLEAHEILELDLNRTALVTLSACESGLGRVAQGDEVLGFTRSFLSAGSSSLIASLWPVSDDATAVLMGTLYQALADGQDIQRAMQAGQRAVLAQPRMSHPFFWAPFNLIGNWRLGVAGAAAPPRTDRNPPGVGGRHLAVASPMATEH